MIVEVVIAEELVHNLERRAGSGTSKDSSSIQISVVSNDGGKSSSSGPVQMEMCLLGPQEVLRMQFKLPVTERSGLELRGMMKYLQPMRT